MIFAILLIFLIVFLLFSRNDNKYCFFFCYTFFLLSVHWFLVFVSFSQILVISIVFVIIFGSCVYFRFFQPTLWSTAYLFASFYVMVSMWFSNVLCLSPVTLTVTVNLLLLLLFVMFWTYHKELVCLNEGRRNNYLVCTTFVVWFFSQLVTSTLLMYVTDTSYEVYQENVSSNMLLFVVLTLVIAPIIEECIIRGFLYGWIRRYNKTFAFVVSTIIFVALHQTLAHIPITILMSLWSVMAYEKSGKLRTCIIIHMYYNFFSLCGGLLPIPYVLFLPYVSIPCYVAVICYLFARNRK